MSAKFDLVLGIRSGSVGVCAFSHEKKAAVPTALYATRLQIPLQKEFNSQRGLSDMATAVSRALSTARKNQPGPARLVTVVVGTPWYISQTRTVVYKGERPFLVSKKFVDDLLSAQTAAFIDEHYKEGQAEIIERAVMKIALNGYPTLKPYGKMAKEVEISFYLSLADKSFTDTVRKEVATAYHYNLVKFQTFTFVAWHGAAATVLGAAQDLVFIDIGGETSEWTLIEQGCLTESISFPLGAHTIIRDIAKTFNIALEEARSLYGAYLQKRVSAAVEKKVADILSGVRLKWATYVSGIIQKLSNTHILPTQYCVISTFETGKLFCQTLDSKEIQALSMPPAAHSCILPTPGDLKSFYQETLLGKPDIFLAFEMLFVDKYSSSL